MIDPGLALGAVFTAAGAPLWGIAVQTMIQVLKMVPQFVKVIDGREKLICFVASGAVVVLAYTAGLQAVPPERTLDIVGVTVVLLSWFTLARLSMTAYDDFVARGANGRPPSESVLSAKGWDGK